MGWSSDVPLWKVALFYLALFVIFFSILHIFFGANGEDTGLLNITVAEAVSKIYLEEDVLIVDCRGNQTLYNMSHIPGAIWSTNPSDIQNVNQSVIVYCQTGVTSTTYSSQLDSLIEYTVYNLKGGIDEWERQGLPTKRGGKP